MIKLYRILFSLLLLVSAVKPCLSQANETKGSGFFNDLEPEDTALHFVLLGLDTAGIQTVYLDMSDIILFFPLNEFMEECMKGREIFSKIHKFKTKRNSNEIPVAISSHREFEFIADRLLERGQAALFNLRSNKFINRISYRLEYYGDEAKRIYYLPDNRSFFSVVKLTGLTEDTKLFYDKKARKRINEYNDRTID